MTCFAWKTTLLISTTSISLLHFPTPKMRTSSPPTGHLRGFSLDSDFYNIGLGLIGDVNGVDGENLGRNGEWPVVHHRQNISMDGLTNVSSVEADSSMGSERKKVVTPHELAELALIDPSRYRKILGNRQFVPRSKERKNRYASGLEINVQMLKTKSNNLSIELTIIQRKTTELSAENKLLKVQLEATLQQARFRDGCSLNVAYVLTTTKPQEGEEETIDAIRERQKWENDDYICTGHIFNGLCDALFDVYQDSTSAKDLWNKLEARYMQKDATSKKFLVTRFNNYKMINGKSIMDQMHEIEHILNNFKQHDMHMDESIIVSSIIDKLPSSWKDLKKKLKHKKEDISLEQLGNHLRLEEEYRKQDAEKETNVQEKVHMVEEGQSNRTSKKRGKDKDKSQAHDGHKNKKMKARIRNTLVDGCVHLNWSGPEKGLPQDKGRDLVYLGRDPEGRGGQGHDLNLGLIEERDLKADVKRNPLDSCKALRFGSSNRKGFDLNSIGHDLCALIPTSFVLHLFVTLGAGFGCKLSAIIPIFFMLLFVTISWLTCRNPDLSKLRPPVLPSLLTEARM
ncbi:uncharacterized protein G2W53_026640 [Senna tora]|uniref:BZIP domain-containing protein n=1 Tax=Senna tora TaxID=362788 RepID=A0A834THU4_9FABA|nr:uncharacterized protein G2W53_026640 [Senna tora]